MSYGIRRRSILGLTEAMVLGFVERTQQGSRAWGEFKGAPAQYRLTWRPAGFITLITRKVRQRLDAPRAASKGYR